MWNCDSPSTADSRRLSESNKKPWCFPQHTLSQPWISLGHIESPQKGTLEKGARDIKRYPEIMFCELGKQIPEKMTAFGIESSLAQFTGYIQRFHLLSPKNQKQQCCPDLPSNKGSITFFTSSHP
jgi:hypothetical protein